MNLKIMKMIKYESLCQCCSTTLLLCHDVIHNTMHHILEEDQWNNTFVEFDVLPKRTETS